MMAEIFGESKHWARTILKQWLAEQQKGGPVRVFTAGKKNALFTTITVLQREMPPTRDRYVTKKLAEHDRDLDDLARKVTFLTSEVAYLRKLVASPNGVREAS